MQLLLQMISSGTERFDIRNRYVPFSFFKNSNFSAFHNGHSHLTLSNKVRNYFFLQFINTLHDFLFWFQASLYQNFACSTVLSWNINFSNFEKGHWLLTLNEKVSVLYGSFLFLVVNQTHLYPKELKSASFKFFHRWT